ncbi:MAG: hypothetical protein KDA60_02015 [Planctomycetales bacterium]|nr:hypothetical protein [Planctomycetales bacterium]
MSFQGNSTSPRRDITSELLWTLCHKVRLVTTQQIAAHFYATAPNPCRRATSLCRKLARAGLIEKHCCSLASINVEKPLYSWEPSNGSRPDFDRLDYQNACRWQSAPKPETTIMATNRARALFGGFPRKVRHNELEHDVALTGVYLRLAARAPSVAQTFQLEDSISPQLFSGRRPDAILPGPPLSVIDVIGRGYDAKKLQGIWMAFREFPIYFC